MQLRFKDDYVEIEGYVNTVERKSKPLKSRIGKFVERIKKGAFKRAIERNDNIRILLNHNWDKDLGGTKEGNLKLWEDNIGLRFKLRSNDEEIIKKGRRGELVGCSFGFSDVEGGVDEHEENGMLVRDVKDLDLFEVSILDRSKVPAYDGTLVTVRSDDEIQYRGEPLYTEIEIRDESQPKQHENVEKEIDYSKYEKLIEDMKGEK